MLKFIKHNMETIVGIEIFPIISFIIFFGFFTGLLIYVVRLRRTHIDVLSALPLDPDSDSVATTDTPNTPAP